MTTPADSHSAAGSHSPAGSQSNDEQLEALLAEALEAHDHSGEAGVDAVCAANPQQASRIRALLRKLDLVGGIKDQPRDFPERLGPFRLLHRIGGGGMGMVFEAETDSPRRRVALKVVRPELLPHDNTRARFRREITAVARLQHPAIVPVLESGETDGVPWLAMSLVSGMTLDAISRGLREHGDRATLAAQLQQFRDGAPLPGPYWQQCVHWIAQAADGMRHAHEEGVVHRDLKPSNIMVARSGQAMVLDFGLAHVQDNSRLTRTGSQLGSPAFMSPQQMLGLPTDARTDVYSLAATLYQLLALQPPFPPQEPQQLRIAILAGTRAPLLNLAPEIPRDLAIVVDAAMDIDPARRYRSMAALAQDLRAVLDGRVIRARRTPISLRLLRLAGRHRLATAALLLALLLLSITPLLLLARQHQGNGVLAAENERARANLDTALLGLDRLLGHAGALRDTGLPRGVEWADRLQLSASKILQRVTEQEFDDPAIRLRLARTQVELASMQAASLPHQDGMALLRASDAELAHDTVLTADARANLRARLAVARGRLQFAAGDAASAKACLDDAEALLRPAVADAYALRLAADIADLRATAAIGAPAAAAAADIAVHRWQLLADTAASSPEGLARALLLAASTHRKAGAAGAAEQAALAAIAALTGAATAAGHRGVVLLQLLAAAHGERFQQLTLGGDAAAAAASQLEVCADWQRIADREPFIPGHLRQLAAALEQRAALTTDANAAAEAMLAACAARSTLLAQCPQQAGLLAELQQSLLAAGEHLQRAGRGVELQPLRQRLLPPPEAR